MDPDDLADDLDQASSEINQSLTLRLRDRERFLITKIDQALDKIEEGTFGICEECDDPIGFKRLDVRGVTTFCIRCKEEQERLEKMQIEEKHDT
jgi:DnaK suppressor protein